MSLSVVSAGTELGMPSCVSIGVYKVSSVFFGGEQCFQGAWYQEALDRAPSASEFWFGRLHGSYLFIVKLKVYSNRQVVIDVVVFEAV